MTKSEYSLQLRDFVWYSAKKLIQLNHKTGNLGKPFVFLEGYDGIEK